MSAKVLTIAEAKNAKLSLIENGKGTQAVHDVVVALRAARRSGTASTKTKATVNLSGKKPWRQKGTGRARAGYASSPVWVGGGVVFGPHPRDYSKKVTKSVKRLALRKALSSRIAAGDVLVVDAFAVKEAKTRQFVKLVADSTKLAPKAKVLVISKSFDETTTKAGRNVKPVQLVTSADVNTEQLLAYKKIIVTNDALSQLAERTSN
ncbi:MAG TPA: 50S ribosomal protein L4 [Chthoniobacteraceae bacterium]|nr:50S ribosomal protein L4 [Chthoniobacteraceae bacterium]